MTRPPRLAWTLPLLLALAPAAWAQERTGQVERVESDLRSEDYEKAFDVVVVGEGYGVAEADQFFADAKRLARRVRVEVTAKPIRDSRPFNFHFAFVNARESGVPWQPGKEPRDTPLKGHVTVEGDLTTDDAQADLLAAKLAPDVDCVVVLVKLSEETGGPTTPDVLTREDVRPNADVPSDGCRVRIISIDTEAFIHELGHAIYALSDEYSDFDEELPEELRWEVAVSANLTLSPSNARWKDLVSTPPVEGGNFYARGVWRPEKKCRMRETRTEKFCDVCVDVIMGAHAVRPPQQPSWLAPEEEQRLKPTGGTLTLDARWRHASAGPAVRPLYFSVTLRRLGPDGRPRVVFEDDVEGHLRSVPIEIGVRKAGSYVLDVRAVNLAGASEIASRRFTVGRPRGREGMTGRLTRE